MNVNNSNKVENSIDNDAIAGAHQFDWNQFYAIPMWKNRIDKAIKLCKFHVINTLKGKQFQSFFLFAEIEWEKNWDEMSTSIRSNPCIKYQHQTQYSKSIFEKKNVYYTYGCGFIRAVA